MTKLAAIRITSTSAAKAASPMKIHLGRDSFLTLITRAFQVGASFLTTLLLTRKLMVR